VSNLVVRTLSSIAFVVLIIGPLFLDETRFSFLLYSTLGILTLLEVLKMIRKTGSEPNTIGALVIYLNLVVIGYGLFYELFSVTSFFFILACTVLLISVVELFRIGSRPFENVSTSIFAPIFTASSFVGITYFLVYRDDLPSILITISLFALIWINDSGAYLIGRSIGRTKLFERLSPNKTWEGSLGGMTCAFLAAIGLSYIDGMPGIPQMLGFAFTCILFGALGDLFESRLKRAAGVKDSGKFLPGHGGFFDRFDAMMFAIPASILYFEAILPK
jgi:phosphatidate cytidylyltransferase